MKRSRGRSLSAGRPALTALTADSRGWQAPASRLGSPPCLAQEAHTQAFPGCLGPRAPTPAPSCARGRLRDVFTCPLLFPQACQTPRLCLWFVKEEEGSKDSRALTTELGTWPRGAPPRSAAWVLPASPRGPAPDPPGLWKLPEHIWAEDVGKRALEDGS